MKILVIEDDKLLSQALAEALTDQRYIVDVIADPEQSWTYLSSRKYDLILLDIMLPKLDGITLCRQLRADGYSMPILMLTALSRCTDKVRGLDAGADDYLVKPIDFAELFARVRAALRRDNIATASNKLYWDELELDPNTYEVTYQNQPLHLTPKEYSVLELLVRNGRRVLSRTMIISHLWSVDDPPGEETVKAHIKRLRKKLQDAGAPKNFIETVHSLGYRLKHLS
jgi:DNA-binding response OmpR family regulator